MPTDQNSGYLFEIDLNTAALGALFIAQTTEVALMAEVTWTASGITRSSQTFDLVVARDIYRGDEINPSPLPDLKASQAEAEAGLDNTKWMTPLRAAQAIAAKLAASVSVAWNSITGKPETFPPSTHTHIQAEVTGLAAALSAKLSTAELPALQFQRNGDALTFNQYGSLLQQLVGAADSRLTNARQPTPHAATHGAEGSDPIIFTAASPLLLASPDGSLWELTISNDGTLVREKLPA